jgi:hypothetical protein
MFFTLLCGACVLVASDAINSGRQQHVCSTLIAYTRPTSVCSVVQAALRRIADPDAPERPVASPENAPLLRFPKKERPQAELRRCNST